MRTLILSLAIAGALASPLALAQSHGGGGGGGGGPPAGVGGGNGGGMGGPPMGMPSGSMGGSMGADMRNDMGNTHSIDGRSRAMFRRDNARTPEQAMFGLSTADRAKLLKDSDVETRKAFGAYQAALAKAKSGERLDAATLAEAADRAGMQSFGADTKARALELKDADRRTRKAFGRFQSALARQHSLESVAGTPSVQAAFGAQTAASAKSQADADKATRTEFGANQAIRAKAQATAKAEARKH